MKDKNERKEGDERKEKKEGKEGSGRKCSNGSKDKNDKNGKKTSTLPGASLLETVTASLLFLLVFTISLETMVRLRAGAVSPQILTEADRLLEECIRECRKGNYPPDGQTRTFSWGELVFHSAPYEKYPPLIQMTLTLRLKRPFPAGGSVPPQTSGSKTGDPGSVAGTALFSGPKLERTFLAIPRETDLDDIYGTYYPGLQPN